MPKLPDVPLRWLLEEPESTRLRQQNLALWESPQTSCITCRFELKENREKTFRWWNDVRTEIVTWECNCIHQWIMNRYMLNNGIENDQQRFGWGDIEVVSPGILEAAQDYLENSYAFVDAGLGLVFHSPNRNTGKTLMLILMAKRLMWEGFDVFTAQMTTVIDLYRKGWKSETGQEHFERRIMNCQVLILDGMGQESTGDNSVEFIDRLVDRVLRHRAAAGYPTLIGTPLGEDGIAQKYGDRISGILTGHSTFVDASGAAFTRLHLRTMDEARKGLKRPLVVM